MTPDHPLVPRQRFLSRRRFLSAIAGSLAATRLTPRTSRGQSTGATGHVAWLDDVQTPPPKLPEKAPKLRPLLVGSNGSPITDVAAWEDHRRKIRQWWSRFIGEIRLPRSGPPPYEVIEEEQLDGVVRQRIRYKVDPRDASEVEAYLLRPAKLPRPAPAVVALHSTVHHSIRQPAGVEGKPEKAFGLKLAQKGLVAICPRNFLWPNNHHLAGGQERVERVEAVHRQYPGSRGMAKMLLDAVTAVDLLTGMKEVDADRLGCVGHSLGAKEVLYLAAMDNRIKATVSSEGGIGTRFCNWYAPWYLGEAIRESSFAHEHHELLALVAPRAFLLVGGDKSDGAHSWPFIEAALPVYRLYGGRPRLGLFNHGKGHCVPPEAERRIDEWLTTYL